VELAPVRVNDEDPLATLVEQWDWAATPLGARDRWPASLASFAHLCLESRFPIILFWGPEFVQIYNDAYRPLLGTRHPAALGQTARACWPDVWAETLGPMLAGVTERSEATWSDNVAIAIERDGVSEERYFTFSASPAREDGRIVGVFCTARETTDVIQAQRLRTISDAIAQSVPQIVWTADADGNVNFLNARFEEYTGISSDEAMQYGWLRAVPRDEGTTILARFNDARASGRPMNFEHRLWHRSSRTYRSVLVRANASVDAAGAVTGWVGTLTDVDDDRRARERDHHASEAFQLASLPKALPAVPGVRFSAEYHAAEAQSLVGGDWYDAFELTDGRIAVSVGDVMGSGLDSAVTMAAARQAIRGAAQIYPDPRAVLDAADRALHSEQPDRIVTAFVGVFEPITGFLTYASAGHPPPMLRRADGAIVELLDSSLPLGLRSQVGGRGDISQTIHLEPGSLLVLYTDGLTEATRNTAEGEARVRDALARADRDGAGNVARFIRRDVLAGVPADDVAILTLAVGERAPEHTTRWTISTTDALTAVRLRRDVAALLRDRGASESEAGDAELILGELLGNVVRHTQGDVEVALDTSGEFPVVHVLDRGRGFTFIARLPQDEMSETGRGLFISAMLARDLTVVRRPDGGSHARAVLPGRLRAVSRTGPECRAR
jgi:PAS domain S-box-containing protein